MPSKHRRDNNDYRSVWGGRGRGRELIKMKFVIYSEIDYTQAEPVLQGYAIIIRVNCN